MHSAPWKLGPHIYVVGQLPSSLVTKLTPVASVWWQAPLRLACSLMVDDQSIVPIHPRPLFQHHKRHDLETRVRHPHQASRVPSNRTPASPAMKPIVGAFQAWSWFVTALTVRCTQGRREMI